MIIKSIPLVLKDIDKSTRTIKAYFVNYETAARGIGDSDNDRIFKGAYTKSIKEVGPGTSHERIKHLFNHWDTVGKFKELIEDDFGLLGVSELGRHTKGNDTLLMYEDGIITEHSHGFELVKDKFKQNELGGKDIFEARLWEGSSLDKWGANMYTPATKSKEEFDIWSLHWLDRYDKLTKALRNRTNYTDDTYNEIVIQLEVMKTTFENVLKELKPEASTQQVVESQKKEVDIAKIISNLNFKF